MRGRRPSFSSTVLTIDPRIVVSCTHTTGTPGRAPGAVEGFIGTALGRQEPDEMQKKGDEGGVLPTDLPIILLPRGQRWKGGPEMTLGIRYKPCSLPKPCHCPHRTKVTTSLRLRAAWGPGWGSGGKEVLQKSSAITYRIVRKVSTSTIEMLLVLGKREQF